MLLCVFLLFIGSGSDGRGCFDFNYIGVGVVVYGNECWFYNGL